ncbi:Serine protease Do (heat-shock protein) [Halalkaliarchaeum sp. AArc-CO]|uniref:S1C family serine protease n=1 Tax=Halalkaliarchaeum sp. AArc-CO TaxID=2866381 RepID=UPI00217EDB1C|nr:trypsin-like peptidase domain-containing protein [Halalkaliarchaeum sp. AArc-CO]UWG50447.1 Serine protease Do (heat-shock protein) [Halalkaliarchaeum sp. AArc-CO]
MKNTRRGFLATAGTVAIAGCTSPATEIGPDDDPNGNESATGEGNLTEVADEGDDSETYTAVAESVSQSVVRVQIYEDGIEAGQGSGFLHRGHVVTNEHVVYGGDTVRLQYADGAWYEADIVGTDPYSDLAVLSPGRDLEAAAAPSELELVDRTPDIGTEVLAFGAPFGLGGSVTQGIISGRNRSLPAPNDYQIPDAVQTDAAVNPGNSGGPLVTLDQEVAGVVTATRGENVGFAVSAPLSDRIVPSLIEDGEYEHSRLGVQVRPVTPTVAEVNDLEEVRGVYVVEVVSDGPADGVLEGATDSETVGGQSIPTGGDVIVGFEDTEIATNEDLARFLALETSPGETIDVHVIRDGERVTESLTLGTRPPAR